MSIPGLRTVAFGIFLALPLGGTGSLSRADSPAAGDPKAEVSKPGIVLPKDPKAVVLSYDPGAGGFIRKGPPPNLQIQADGRVTVTNLFDGSKKESKLTPRQLEDLLRFAIRDNDFFNLSQTRIADAIKAEIGNGPAFALGGVGTTVISVQANGKRHEVSYRGASEYLRAYPKAKALAQFVAVEKRLSDLAASVAKGK